MKLSKCCKAEVLAVSGYPKDEGTHYWQCSKCGAPCDIIIPSPSIAETLVHKDLKESTDNIKAIKKMKQNISIPEIPDNSQVGESMEERFDEKFTYDKGKKWIPEVREDNRKGRDILTTPQEMKSFISQEVERGKEEERERILKLLESNLSFAECINPDDENDRPQWFYHLTREQFEDIKLSIQSKGEK